MKKVAVLGVLFSMILTNTAFADVLPEGTKTVPVCAYFNNTESVLDEMAIYGYETAPDGSMVSMSSFIDDECFTKAYKFNTYTVYGLTAEHALEVSELDPYDPSDDPEAYPTNILPELGEILVDPDSNVKRIENEYMIAELDLENGMLLIVPVKTTKYFTDETEPEVIEGTVTVINEDIELEDAFIDVGAATSQYYTAIKYLKDNDIIHGYPDGTYKPDNTINRAEFTKIVMGSVATADAIAGCNEHFVDVESTTVTLFTDVEFRMAEDGEPEWYYDYVCMAKLNGVIHGYPDGSFKPAMEINFVESAKIVTEAMGYQMMTETEPWFMGYVKQLEDLNAIPTSITGFDHKITRGEMAEIMYRLMAEVTNLTSLTYEGLE